MAIENYSELLEHGGKVVDDRKGKIVYTLLPLNGEERFEFVKDKISSHYAYIQLDALYTETKKKVARLSIQKEIKKQKPECRLGIRVSAFLDYKIVTAVNPVPIISSGRPSSLPRYLASGQEP